MQFMNSKDTVIGLIQDMPKKISMSEIVYRLHVIDEIKKGEDDFAKDHILSHAALKKKMAKWAM